MLFSGFRTASFARFSVFLAFVVYPSFPSDQTTVSTAVPSLRPFPERVAALDQDLPLRFEANRGQSDRRVQFLSRGPGYELFLTPGEAVLVMPSCQPSLPRHSALPFQQARSNAPSAPLRSWVLRLQLVGGNPAAEAEGVDPLARRTNYFTGHDPARWRTNVTTYARVKHKNVYPGVDLLYYGRQGHLEYDFVIAPGADPASIQLRFTGIRHVRVRPNGDLSLETAMGRAEHHKPVIYQDIDGVRQVVRGRYVRQGRSRVGFQVAL